MIQVTFCRNSFLLGLDGVLDILYVHAFSFCTNLDQCLQARCIKKKKARRERTVISHVCLHLERLVLLNLHD